MYFVQFTCKKYTYLYTLIHCFSLIHVFSLLRREYIIYMCENLNTHKLKVEMLNAHIPFSEPRNVVCWCKVTRGSYLVIGFSGSYVLNTQYPLYRYSSLMHRYSSLLDRYSSLLDRYSSLLDRYSSLLDRYSSLLFV